MTTSDAVYHAKYYKEKDSEGIRLAPHIHDGDGTIKVRGFFTDVSQLPMRVQVWELAPDVSEGSHTHEGDGSLEEIYYFLEGAGIVWADDEVIPVEAGDAMMAPPGVEHGVRNTGTEPLKFVIIWGPPAGGYPKKT